MVKRHLARLTSPKTWPVSRKRIRFIARPLPGAHNFMLGLPIVIALRDLLRLGETAGEIKKILNLKQVLVDGRRVKEPKFMLGLFDVLQIPDLKLNYRLSINSRGKLCLHEISAEEAKIKICRIIRKHALKGGKINLTFHDGKNCIVKGADYKVGDSVLFEFNKGITKKLPVKKGAIIFLVGGRHIGTTGELVDVVQRKLVSDEMIVKTKKEQFSTLQKYVYIIGEDKQLIKV
ncbi:30S ribosomal protein S4e [Candidatus Woesearchaeota archaeon]|nr:30S ribosomal protein S4e [Candidatus Woesearchaeota archaeon]